MAETRYTVAEMQTLRELAEAATRDWPAVKRWIDGAGVMAHVHGAPYNGPSIDFDAMITAFPRLVQQAAADLERLERCLSILRSMPEPFHAVVSDSDGIWWGCDWCHLDGAKSVCQSDERTKPDHPPNGCLYLELAAPGGRDGD